MKSLQPDEIDQLKDFCENSLAYLLDDGRIMFVNGYIIYTDNLVY